VAQIQVDTFNKISASFANNPTTMTQFKNIANNFQTQVDNATKTINTTLDQLWKLNYDLHKTELSQITIPDLQTKLAQAEEPGTSLQILVRNAYIIKYSSDIGQNKTALNASMKTRPDESKLLVVLGDVASNQLSRIMPAMPSTEHFTVSTGSLFNIVSFIILIVIIVMLYNKYGQT
jgi:hypothetical protein